MTDPEDRDEELWNPPLWSRDLAPAKDDVPWIWDGYLAPGNITLLTSQWKSGKTTLLSVLLARRAAGSSLAGRALKSGGTIVVSEEAEDFWKQRRRTLDFSERVGFYCRPFRFGRPSRDQWQLFMENVVGLHRREGVDLLVIDPLANFLPTFSESSPRLVLNALWQFDDVRSAGMAVLLLHHPKKGRTMEGQWARGPGTLSHFIDILIEMRPYRTLADGDRRRVLHSWSRFAATPRQLVIEWTADGADYRGLGAVADEEFREHWEQIAGFFATAPDKLTRRELRALWPAGPAAPSEQTLWRWLERAVAAQLLRREGTGHKNAPYRYWLPAREAEWQADPLRKMMMDYEARQAEIIPWLSQPMEPIVPKPRRRKKGGDAAPADESAGASG